MIGLICLEVYNSIFNITEENNKFELYTYNFDEFSLEELKIELDEILSNSDIIPTQLQHEITGQRIIQAYKKLKSEKSSTDGDIIPLMGYAIFPFRDFENYLRVVVGLDEDDIQMISKQHNSFFIIYELSLGTYTTKDNSEAVHTMDDHEGNLQIEYGDISMKTKLTLTRFGSTFGTLRFDEKSFFGTLLSFTPYWDYKPTNAILFDSPDGFTRDNLLK